MLVAKYRENCKWLSCRCHDRIVEHSWTEQGEILWILMLQGQFEIASVATHETCRGGRGVLSDFGQLPAAGSIW